nr:hypothetical protein [uncultured Dysosmobacter sp.]
MDDTQAEGPPFLNFHYFIEKNVLYLTASGQYSSAYGKIGRTITKCVVRMAKNAGGHLFGGGYRAIYPLKSMSAATENM